MRRVVEAALDGVVRVGVRALDEVPGGELIARRGGDVELGGARPRELQPRRDHELGGGVGLEVVDVEPEREEVIREVLHVDGRALSIRRAAQLGVPGVDLGIEGRAREQREGLRLVAELDPRREPRDEVRLRVGARDEDVAVEHLRQAERGRDEPARLAVSRGGRPDDESGETEHRERALHSSVTLRRVYITSAREGCAFVRVRLTAASRVATLPFQPLPAHVDPVGQRETALDEPPEGGVALAQEVRVHRRCIAASQHSRVRLSRASVGTPSRRPVETGIPSLRYSPLRMRSMLCREAPMSHPRPSLVTPRHT